MKALGIDIGTTTVSAAVVDSETGKIIATKTIHSESFIQENGNTQVQDVSKILDKVNQICTAFSYADFIGVTCQMHGILYIDSQGNALSNLYTWQDTSGNDVFINEKTYVEYITEKTGYKVATGFGLVTHFVHKNSSKGNISHNLVNNNANSNKVYKLCTIGDYIAMKLANAKEPIMHSTNAAGLGLFNVEKHCFDLEALHKLNIDTNLLPEVTSDYCNYPHSNISVAIGDNQASFMGSVADMAESLLVNIGTSGQISYLSSKYRCSDTLEVRPFDRNSFLYVGATLCGGRAYALLYAFMKKVAEYFDCSPSNLYDIIDTMAENVDKTSQKINVNTRFAGTRSNPLERGSISNIGIDNFTPENLASGILEGISSELYDLYDKVPKTILVASGNALRKNKLLCKVVSEQFGLPLRIPTHNEEASYGAALFAMVANKIYGSIQEAQKIITLEKVV